MIGTRVRWTIAFLIGLATVTAAAFGWRAAADRKHRRIR